MRTAERERDAKSKIRRLHSSPRGHHLRGACNCGAAFSSSHVAFGRLACKLQCVMIIDTVAYRDVLRLPHESRDITEIGPRPPTART